MVDATIVKGIQNYLRQLVTNGIEISFGVVFGSQASGRPHRWSDIDLIVVSPLFDQEITRENINKLWRTAARTDSRIEPIPCGERQWREDTSSPIIEIARIDGATVHANS